MNNQEILDGISKLLNGDNTVFINTQQAFKAINIVLLGQLQADQTDNILERYDNEEYYEPKIIEWLLSDPDVPYQNKIINLSDRAFGKPKEPLYLHFEDLDDTIEVYEITKSGIHITENYNGKSFLNFEELDGGQMYDVLQMLQLNQE